MKTVKKRSQIQEKGVAKDLSARTVVASGSLWHAKGDVRNDKFLIECKTTLKPYYVFTTKTWEKICREANTDSMRTPIMVIDLEDRDRYVVFNPNHFSHEINSYEIGSKIDPVSFRFYGTKECKDETLLFSMKSLAPNKLRHMLMAMPIEKFLEEFKEEL